MKKCSQFALLALAAWGLPAAAAAQTANPAATPPRVVTSAEGDKVAIEQVAAGRARGGVVAPVETRTTVGKPYSAEAVTESLQVLGDGNRITRKSITRVYRDNEGRTRREHLATDGNPQSITISDPVAGVSFTLNPATKTGSQSSILAFKSPVLVPTVSGGGSGTGTGGGRGGGGDTRMIMPTRVPDSTRDEVRKVEQARTARIEQAETSQAASGQMRQVVELAASGGGQTTKENLGEQTIEGVRATGTRSTTVIPAGSSVGNLHEIRIVSEQWFSADLEVLVLTKHSDPRVGETIYRLQNIVRAQPDPNMFVAPPDYKIRGRQVRNEQ